MELPAEEVPEVPGQSPEGSEGVPMTEVSRQRVSSWIRAAMVAGKRCCPIPVNRGIVAGEPAVILVQIVQLWSNGVT